jgi:nitrite reductase/ring-hydroxylating ferredoxin subunit
VGVVNASDPLVSDVSDIPMQPAGTVRVEQLPDGSEIAVARLVDGQVARFSNLCPHRGGPIGEGKLADRIITCPWHGFRFDVLTGEAVGLESTMRLCRISEEASAPAPSNP